MFEPLLLVRCGGGANEYSTKRLARNRVTDGKESPCVMVLRLADRRCTVRRTFLTGGRIMSTRAPTWAAWLLIASILTVNVLRAAIQSITHDEALTYEWFVAGPWRHVLSAFNANHHVLSSYLIKLSIDTLGVSEFSMRLPSVVAGAVCLVAALLLNFATFGARWFTVFAIAIMTIDPCVMDFMSAARGYGLGWALLLAAIGLLLRSMDTVGAPESGSRRSAMLASGVLLGCSAAANFAYVIPGTALAVAFLLVVAERTTSRGDPWPVAARRWLAWMVMPGVTVFLAIVAPPLRSLERGAFGVGADSLHASLRSLLVDSLTPRDGLLEAGAPLSRVADAMIEAGPVLFIGVMAVAVAMAAQAFRQHGPPESGRASCRRCRDALGLVGGTLVLASGLMVIARHALGVNYPEGRMGIYVLPLLAFCSLCVVEIARTWPRTIRLVFAVPVLGFWSMALVLYGANLDVTQYRTWTYDRSTRRYVEYLRAEHATMPDRVIRIGLSWPFEPSLNFYRSSLGLHWMPPATRVGPVGNYDYFVLMEDDRRLVTEWGLRVIAEDEVAGTVLAARAFGVPGARGYTFRPPMAHTTAVAQ